MADKLVTLSWMNSYHAKLKQFLADTFYKKSEVNTLIANVEAGSAPTIRGTRAQIEAMDLTTYPNGTIVIMED